MSTNTKKIFLTGGAFLPDVTEANNNNIMVVENGKWVMKDVTYANKLAGLSLHRVDGKMWLIDKNGIIVGEAVDLPKGIKNIEMKEEKTDG